MFDWLRSDDIDVEERMQELRTVVERGVVRAMERAADRTEARVDLLQEIEMLEEERQELQRDLADLRAKKSEVEEEHERERREIEHKVGLHKERVEQERELARKEAELDQREKHLDDQLDVLEERADMIEAQADELKEIMREFVNLFAGKIPDSEIIARIGTGQASEASENGE